VVNLGCKVNQAEAEFLAGRLAEQGVLPAQAGQPADLAILLTCAVTATASRQARQMARRLAKTHPGALVVVTGCDAQAEPMAYREQGFLVLGRSRLAEIPALVQDQGPWPWQQDPAPPDAGPFCPGLRLPGPARTRGLLKVQDGCDAGCAYCIVPLTRGRPRSLPLKEAAAALRRLAQAGAMEVVLTGVHLGRYGGDLDPRQDLTDLIMTLLKADPGPRLRLSSLEVNEITDPLLALLAENPRLCRHLHIPLQTGSDRLLKAMGRPYTAAQFAQTVQKAARAGDGICLGADVLAGLPGEDDAAFDQTFSLIESLPLAYLHVFPFSPRPGTAAARMSGRPPGPEVRRRAAMLRRLGEDKREAFLKGQMGRRLEAVVEGSRLGRTGNYCLVRLDRKLEPGAWVEVEITSLDRGPGRAQLAGRVV